MINAKKSRVLLRKKTITNGALGQTETIAPVGWKYAAVIPLDAKAMVAYQQLNSIVSHRVIFSGKVDIEIGTYDILWGDKVLTPVGPVQIIDGDTVLVVSE